MKQLLVLVLLTLTISCQSTQNRTMNANTSNRVTRMPFGTTSDGTSVDVYTLSNTKGMRVKIATYGATITELHVPDRNGNDADVVVGYGDMSGLQGKNNPFFGATVGRYANRIARGKFTIDGREYQLPVNNGPNSLHGGKVGFDKVVWKAEPVGDPKNAVVRFKHISPAGDQGYPGTLGVQVTFTLNDKNELRIDYQATTDAPTPVNLTNHAYFNLAGNESGSILDTQLMINADRYTVVDADLIPTGELKLVRGTYMDFTSPTPIGARINQVTGGGYDHNYVINNGGTGKMVLAARAMDPKSGRVMEVETDQPGVQLYTGNFLDGKITGKNNATYDKYGAFCLETQHFPDSPNHANFPSTILRPGQTYKTSTVYRFSAK
ncbi:MAG: galactose mutarotase [Anaerolineae bacterium]|nr:galactose mutarotase [Phycisphaerae bacterium]